MAKRPTPKKTGKKPAPRSRATTKPGAAKQGAPKRAGERRSFWRTMLRWAAVSFIWGTLALAGLIGWYVLDLPDPDMLAGERKGSVTVLAADGSVLATYGELHGTPLHYEDLPPALIQAVLATEDRRFFSHPGVDLRGIARAAWANLRAGGVVEGGSTITQQLAKNLFLTPERSFKRKIQEALLALWLERRFSKQELLAIYFNRVYLGAGTYGADAAARRYFGKPVGELSLAECAMIAGLLKAPPRFNPAADPAAARARTAEVIDNMVEAGFIDAAAAEGAKLAPLDLVGPRVAGGSARYAADWVVSRAADYIGTVAGDIVITTTIDPQMERAAGDVLAAALAGEGMERNAHQGAIVAMAPDGAVMAMVGGADYSASQFNRAVQAQRQPGSAFKLFVYLAALEAGMRPDDVVIDQPVTIQGWSPGNFDGDYRGAVSLRQALADSINTVAADVAWRVGMKNVVGLAHRLGITAELPPLPSLALGTTEVTPLELTAAYAALANQGNIAWPYVITHIATREGQVLYQRQTMPQQRVLDPAVVAGMVDMLAANIQTGTGKAAAIDRPAAGKTGTSQDYRDAWFVGFTRGLVTGVWVGNDNNTPMDRVTGGGLPARIWSEFMLRAEAGRPVLALLDAAPPPGETDAGGDGGSFDALLDSLFGELAGGEATPPDDRGRDR